MPEFVINDIDEPGVSDTEVLDLTPEEQGCLTAHSFSVESECPVEEEYEYSLAVAEAVVKFDTACTTSMSGQPGRLTGGRVEVPGDSIPVRGFNGSRSTVDAVGLNSDGKQEFFLRSMPPNLTLLSAHQYVQDGTGFFLSNDFLIFPYFVKLIFTFDTDGRWLPGRI